MSGEHLNRKGHIWSDLITQWAPNTAVIHCSVLFWLSSFFGTLKALGTL